MKTIDLAIKPLRKNKVLYFVDDDGNVEIEVRFPGKLKELTIDEQINVLKAYLR